MSASDVPPPQAPVKKRHVFAGVAVMGALGAIAGGIGNQFLPPAAGPTTVAGLFEKRNGIVGAGIYHVPPAIPASADPIPTPGDYLDNSSTVTEAHGIDDTSDVDDLLAHIRSAKPEPTTTRAPVYRWEIMFVGYSDDPRRYLYLSDTTPFGMIGDGGYVRFADMSLVRYLTARFPRTTARFASPSP